MSFWSNIKIRNKIILMLIFPIAVSAYFSISVLMDKSKILSEMKTVQTLSSLAVKISALVHEMQKERGSTALFLGSKGTEFGTELSAQRNETDKKINDLNAFLKDFERGQFGGEFKRGLEDAMSNLGGIADKRGSASSMTVSAGEIIGYYTNTIASLLDVISHISKLSTNTEITTMTFAYNNFLLGKERAGIERAVLSNTFAADMFGPGMFNRFNSIVAEQNTYLNMFLSLATSEQEEFYKSRMKGEFVDEAARMRKVAFDNADKGGFGIDAPYWFKTQTGKINLLKEVEDRLSNDLNSKTVELKNGAQAALTVSVLVTIIAAITSLLIAYFITRSITGPVGMLSRSMVELASGQGDLTARLKVEGRDEIAETSLSFNRFIEGLHEMIRQVNSNSMQLSSASEQISSATEEMAAGADSQSRQTSETAGAMEEMASSVHLVFENSKKSLAAVDKATREAEDGGKVVEKTMSGMSKIENAVQESAGKVKELGMRSREIEKIVGVINEIASQTNLLALNAAIEAARAGEHGRGFEVVAEEIRKLAEQSSRSTVQIKDIISEIRNETQLAAESMAGVTKEVEDGVRLAVMTGEAFEKIIASIRETADMIKGMAETSKQQATVSDQVAKSVENISSTTKETAAASEEIAQSTQELAKLADNLQHLVEQFKI